MVPDESLDSRNPFLREDGTVDEEKVREFWGIVQGVMDPLVAWLNSLVPAVLEWGREVDVQLKAIGIDSRDIIDQSLKSGWAAEEGDEGDENG